MVRPTIIAQTEKLNFYQMDSRAKNPTSDHRHQGGDWLPLPDLLMKFFIPNPPSPLDMKSANPTQIYFKITSEFLESDHIGCIYEVISHPDILLFYCKSFEYPGGRLRLKATQSDVTRDMND
jgi:hypothetical protein